MDVVGVSWSSDFNEERYCLAIEGAFINSRLWQWISAYTLFCKYNQGGT